MAVEPAGPPTTTPTSVLSVGRVRPTSKPKLNQNARPGSLSPLSSPSPLSGPSSFSPPTKEPTEPTPKGRLAPLAKQPNAATVVPALRTGVAPQRPCVGLSGLKERAALRQQGSVHTSCGDLGATLRRSTLPVATNPTPAALKPEWPPRNSEEEAMTTSFEQFVEEALPGSDARPSTAPTRTDSCKGLPLSLELVRGGQANQFVETEGEGVSLLMSMAGPDSLFGPGNGTGIGLLMQTAGHSQGQTDTQNNKGGSLSRSPDEAIMKDSCGISGSRSGFWASFQEPSEAKQTTEDALDRLFEQRGGPPSARREAGGVAPLKGGFSMLLQCKQEAQEIISARGKDTSGLFQSLSILSEV